MCKVVSKHHNRAPSTLIEESSVLRSKWALAAGVLTSVIATAAQATAQTPSSSAQSASGLIVKLKASADEGKLQTSQQVTARFGRLGRLSVAAGYTSVMPWRHINAQTILLSTPSTLTPALQQKLTDKLMATGQVQWVVPNVRQPLAAISDPNDPYYNDLNPALTPADQEAQWWLMPDAPGRRGVPNIRPAWNTSTGGNQALASRAVVAVLDTGIRSHEDLPTMGAALVAGSSNILPGHDFVSNPAFAGDGDGWDASALDPGDGVSASQAVTPAFVRAQCGVQSNSWHGTIVTGVLAAKSNNGLGVAGVNWHAQVMPVRVAGKCGADLADIVAGMYWAAGKSVPSQIVQQEQRSASDGGYAAPVAPLAGSSTPARVVNISFGGSGSCDSLYQEAIDALASSGVVVVAAAGNEHGAVSRPGNCRGVVAVAALNRTGFKATYSNFGSEITVSTVGGDPGPSSDHPDGGAWGSLLGDSLLLSIFPDPVNGSVPYAYHAGTSYSAPIVSGVISLMLDVNPALSVSQIIEGLKVSSRPHVVSSLIGACTNENPGRCICTSNTCGAGIVDASEALRYAQSPSTYTRTRVPVDLSTDDARVASAISAAVSLSAQDRGANVATLSTSSGSSSGGGGGALGWLDISALLGLLALGWRFSLRRQ